jgi:3-oxoacyl-[acyl-carrier-protein] synthase II
VVSPVGIGTESFWEALVHGQSGIEPISLFDTSRSPIKGAAEVKDFDPRRFINNEKVLNLCGRSFRFAMAAAQMALKDTGLDEVSIDPVRFGAALGVGSINQYTKDLAAAVKSSVTNSQLDISKFSSDGIYKLYPLRRLMLLPNMATSHLSMNHNIQGPNITLTTGEAASAQAIGEAFRMIQHGHADVMLCGGTDSKIDPVTALVYHHYGLLSTMSDSLAEASRPFDRERTGFVLGEGAGLILLEELSHALRRGGRIYAEMVGYGSSFGAQNGKGPLGHAEGLAMERALNDARLAPEEIEYVNAHAPSGIDQDRREMKGIINVFQSHTVQLPISSIKSMVGNSISAAGALDLIAAALTIKTGIIPPTVNFRHCEFDLDIVGGQAREKNVTAVLSNSFAFSGHNVTLVVSRYLS